MLTFISRIISPLLMVLIFPSASFSDIEKAFIQNTRSAVLVTAYNSKGDELTEGTGFIASHDGAVVTNYHVIGIAKRIKITAGSRELIVEGVIHADQRNDVVVLKVKATDLPAVRFGDTGGMEAGEKVYLVSCSKEHGTELHEGIFNGIRDVSSNGKVLRIAAPVSHGSSGSPVLNRAGDVIGIATFLVRRPQNIVLAMPADLIRGRTVAEHVTPLEETIRNYRKSADYWFYLGYFLAEAGADKNAEEVLKEAARLRPGHADTHYYLGTIYDRTGKNRDAIREYKQAVRLSPDLTDAHFGLGVAYGRAGMYKESLAALKQAVRIEHDFADAHYHIGIAYAKLGMFRESIEASRETVRLRPDFTDAYYNLGIACIRSGEYREAVSPLQKAVSLRPGFAEAHYNLGMVYLALGNKRAALEQHAILTKLDPELAGKLLRLTGE